VPQLVKGGKWVFGWAIVGADGEIPIPPKAFLEYKYQFGEEVYFIKGSQTSGGFSIGRSERLTKSKINLGLHLLSQGMIDQSRMIAHPSNLDLKPGERLLVVRGSGVALGFLQRGPIYEEALRYIEIETYAT
jgi:hypothetical protein